MTNNTEILRTEGLKREDMNKLDWTLGYAFAAYKEPDRKVVKSLESTTDGDSRYYVSDPTRYYQDLKDNSASAALNYEHKFAVSEMFTPVLNTGVYAVLLNGWLMV